MQLTGHIVTQIARPAVAMCLAAALGMGALSYLGIKGILNGPDMVQGGSAESNSGAIPLVSPPSFANEVLHWQTRTFQAATAASVDPKVGKWLSSDVWLKVGPDNKATAERALTTLDGKFEEAVFYDFANGAITRITAQPLPLPVEAPNCRSEGRFDAVANSQHSAQAIPPFVSLQDLSPAGFRGSQFVFQSAGNPPASSFGQPISVSPIAKTETFELIRTTQAGNGRLVVYVDEANGRLLGWADVGTSGQIVHEEVSGNVEVFAPGQIPQSFFNSDNFDGGCK
jgi:hypothetical protein